MPYQFGLHLDGQWQHIEAPRTHFPPCVMRHKNKVLGGRSVRVLPLATKVVKLKEIQPFASDAAGGLRIMYTGAEEGMVINGGLEDQTSGYSANVPFHFIASPPKQPR